MSSPARNSQIVAEAVLKRLNQAMQDIYKVNEKMVQDVINLCSILVQDQVSREAEVAAKSEEGGEGGKP